MMFHTILLGRWRLSLGWFGNKKWSVGRDSWGTHINAGRLLVSVSRHR